MHRFAAIRRRLPLAVATVASAALAATVVAPAASAAPSFEDGSQFGMHAPQISNGVGPAVSYGSVRLWDSGTAWGQVEKVKGDYWWDGLDRAVGTANTQNVKITMVLGGTPTWAAKDKKAGTYPNKGAASNPKNIQDWRNWVTAVVTRYGDSIDAYQIWNEANLKTFYQGTPKQMAQLTNEAAKIIRTLDPTGKVVAASTTVRLESAYKSFFPKYLKELKKVGWPVDVFAIHTYGPSTADPTIRDEYVAQARKDLRKAGAPARPLWDTEVNYGIKGPDAKKHKDKDITGTKAAAWVAATYLDSIRLGLDRTYWYFWDTPRDLVGIQMYSGQPGAAAYQTTYDRVANAWVDCTSGDVNSCAVDKNGVKSQVAWKNTKGTATFVVPTYATRQCDALNNCQAVAPGSKVQVGSMPLWFDAA